MTHTTETNGQPRSGVVVLGGYGLFGQYVCQGLMRIPGCTVWVAGRDGHAAQVLCSQLNGAASTAKPVQLAKPLQLDSMQADLGLALRSTGAAIVIHCAGPFQNQDYRVAHAAIDAGMHYIDLADASTFVAGITSLQQRALSADVAVISGASSVPALSSAVIAELCAGWDEVHDIDIGISPGNHTPRGMATVSAILSYVGAPIPAWRDGRASQATGWTRPRRMHYAAPVGPRWLVDCDVPDLCLLPAHYPDLKRLQFGAGLELKSLHFALYGLALLRRVSLLPNLARFAKPFKHMSEWLLFAGSDNGAMHVRVRGRCNGQDVVKTWQLIAQHGRGPSVPAAASIAIAKALLQGDLSMRGASPAIGILPLQNYLAELDTRSIRTEIV